ncbi:hypothetical protein HYX12_01030 [Candidatus Woesearchaeota archaeon]|nr:hypothetical protein [Candidatus Woesearchaeota archaeon]
MSGIKIYSYPISEEEAARIRTGIKRWYQAGAVGLGLGVLSYTAESLVRNIGGAESEGMARQIFEVANYLSIGGLIIIISNFMAGPRIVNYDHPSEKEGIEEKL